MIFNIIKEKMKRFGKRILYIIIFILFIVTIIIFIGKLNINNKINYQEVKKEQLEEVAGNNSYILLETHLLGMEEKEQEIKNAYNNGYAEGLKQASSSNAEIQYTYHIHVSGCYTAKQLTIVSFSEREGGYYSCLSCGRSSASFYRWHSAKLSNGWIGEIIQCQKCGCYYTSSSPSQGSMKGTSLGTYNVLSCGKTTSTIESAQIVFK